jgi:hypothetical protein
MCLGSYTVNARFKPTQEAIGRLAARTVADDPTIENSGTKELSPTRKRLNSSFNQLPDDSQSQIHCVDKEPKRLKSKTESFRWCEGQSNLPDVVARRFPLKQRQER